MYKVISKAPIHIIVALTWLICSSALQAQTVTEFVFEEIESFDNRVNGLKIVGTEKDAMAQTEIFFFNNGGNPAPSWCDDYMVIMMRSPGEFYLSFSVILRQNPMGFTSSDRDDVRGCGLISRPQL